MRWGPNSDLYVFEAVDGWQVHVASRRERHGERIGLGYDGQSFFGLSAREAARLVTTLKRAGYRVSPLTTEIILENEQPT